jgi:hypothetical protein
VFAYDSWFKLEPSPDVYGQYKNHFRIIGSKYNRAIYARDHAEPDTGLIDASKVYDDHWFQFEYEGMNIERIEYIKDKALIGEQVPLLIAEKAVENRSKAPQTPKIVLENTVEEESTFERTAGYAITVGTEISGTSGQRFWPQCPILLPSTFSFLFPFSTAGIPEVSSAKTSISVTATGSRKFGQTERSSKKITVEIPVNVDPGAIVLARATALKTTLSVPFVMHQRSRTTGQEVITEGVWKGITSVMAYTSYDAITAEEAKKYHIESVWKAYSPVAY